jgi:HME family heavy-metal exporter
MRCARLAIPGIADLEIEKQVLAPQIKVRVDYAAAAQYGVPAPQVLATLQAWSRARSHADRRGQPPLRAGGAPARVGALGRGPGPDPDRDAERPHPAVEDRHHRGRRRPQPDQPRRRQAAHRAVGQRVRARAVGDRGRHPQVVAETKLPEGYFITLGGQFQAQEEASRLVGLLSIVSLTLMFVVLYSRYKSARCRR